MMSYEIPLSLIRECCGAPVDKEYADNMVAELKINTTALGLMREDGRDLLEIALGLGCVEFWDGMKWRERGRWSALHGDTTYRLHPDCVAVDDTAEKPAEKWIEVFPDHGEWFFLTCDGTRKITLVAAPSLHGFICIEATDGAGETWYLDHWSPYSRWACASIEELVSRSAGDTPRGCLTPTHVIFDGGE